MRYKTEEIHLERKTAKRIKKALQHGGYVMARHHQKPLEMDFYTITVLDERLKQIVEQIIEVKSWKTITD